MHSSDIFQEAFSKVLGREDLGAVTELGDLDGVTPGKAPDVVVPTTREARGRPSVVLETETIGVYAQERGAAKPDVA